MHRIAQANIDRFNLLLKAETDLTKRAMIFGSWRRRRKNSRFAIEKKELLRK